MRRMESEESKHQRQFRIPIRESSPKDEEGAKAGAPEDTVPETNEAHDVRKRMIEPEDESGDNSHIFRSGNTISSGCLPKMARFGRIRDRPPPLELNATLLPELCSEERLEGTHYIFCSVYISRHFPHANITLHIRTEESDMLVEYCGGNHQDSCPREVLHDEGVESSNTISKREVIPQVRKKNIFTAIQKAIGNLAYVSKSRTHFSGHWFFQACQVIVRVIAMFLLIAESHLATSGGLFREKPLSLPDDVPALHSRPATDMFHEQQLPSIHRIHPDIPKTLRQMKIIRNRPGDH
ncbi:hypothetical protein CEXT_773051 [Caerostris extrusa]|uniref:Uncharacterized protein n=1 Tax=Caerostris extrusa TaxID=172846 RepID=A0AAV4QYU0_CAEEX|nr:hypothetical protein CEXT_773051 [Caerostris extrusa]